MSLIPEIYIKKETERTWYWVSREVGKILEEFEEGKHDQKICIKILNKERFKKNLGMVSEVRG